MRIQSPAEPLQQSERELIEFRCFLRVPVFEVGSFVSRRSNEFSFFDRETLTTMLFKEGSWTEPGEASHPTLVRVEQATPLAVIYRPKE